MLSQAQRTTILELHTQQVSKREIARVLGISRVAVRKVLRSNSTTVPELNRAQKAEPHRRQILELFGQCKGNLVRVHEELLAGGAALSYAALTAFCRRHGIGYAPPTLAGQYDFAPGEEMQHDTSPHELELGGKKRKVQTASAVLCDFRVRFFPCYPTFPPVASEAVAGVDSGSLPAASAPGRYRRVCRAEQQSLFGPRGLDRPPRGGARDQGQDRDSTRRPPPGGAPAHRRSQGPAGHAR